MVLVEPRAHERVDFALDQAARGEQPQREADGVVHARLALRAGRWGEGERESDRGVARSPTLPQAGGECASYLAAAHGDGGAVRRGAPSLQSQAMALATSSARDRGGLAGCLA